MPTREYLIVGTYDRPDSFREHLFNCAKDGVIDLTVVRSDADDLARKRGTSSEIQLRLDIVEIFLRGERPFVLLETEEHVEAYSFYRIDIFDQPLKLIETTA